VICGSETAVKGLRTCTAGSRARAAATALFPHACGPTSNPTDESAARNASVKIVRFAPCTPVSIIDARQTHVATITGTGCKRMSNVCLHFLKERLLAPIQTL
jgi:hypothetical protein